VTDKIFTWSSSVVRQAPSQFIAALEQAYAVQVA
jgi:hypothetical protein